MGVGEDGNVGVLGNVTGDRRGKWILDDDWNFSWDDLGVSDEKEQKLVT